MNGPSILSYHLESFYSLSLDKQLFIDAQDQYLFTEYLLLNIYCPGVSKNWNWAREKIPKRNEIGLCLLEAHSHVKVKNTNQIRLYVFIYKQMYIYIYISNKH